MRALPLALALGLAACTSVNPAYDQSRGPADGTSSSGDSSGDSAGSVTADGSTGEAECALHQDLSFRLEAFDATGMVEPLPCAPNPSIWLVPSGSSTFEGTTIHHVQCVNGDVDCLCTGPAFDIDLSLDGEAIFAPGVPSCGPIYLWSAPSPADPEVCEWGGLMMQTMTDQLVLPPAFIASSTLVVPPISPSFTLDLQPEQDGSCMGSCSPRAPGRYQLDVLGELVMADGLSHFVDVAFLDGYEPITYTVQNYTSSINPDCQPQLAWTAAVN